MGARASLCLVVVLLVAGCNGPTAETGAPTGTQTPEVAFPGDASRFGLGDVGALQAAHQEALQGANYRASLAVAANLSRRGIEGTNRTVHVGGDDGGRYLRIVERGRDAQEVYLGPETEYTHSPAEGEYGYRFRDGGFEASGGTLRWFDRRSVDRLFAMLAVGNFRYAGTTERGGTTLLRYEATGVLVGQEGNYTDYDATLVVSEAGVVHRASGSFVEIGRPRGGDGYRQRVAFDWTLETGVGVPEPPDWTREVPTLRLSMSENGTTAVLAHEGGPPVPAGTSIGALVTLGNGTPVDVTAALDEDLAPGDRVALSVVEDGGGYELRVRPADAPAPDSAIRTAGALLFLSDGDWWARVIAGREEGEN